MVQSMNSLEKSCIVLGISAILWTRLEYKLRQEFCKSLVESRFITIQANESGEQEMSQSNVQQEQFHCRYRGTIRSFLVALMFVALSSRVGGATGWIWQEAEKYAECNFRHFEESSMGKPSLLSGGVWLMKGIGAEEVEKLVPQEGIQLTYTIQTEKVGEYHFWARVGWFRARADFEWRINHGDQKGPWKQVPNTYPTINLMELGFFCEVSWADLGVVQLAPGENTLEIRYPKVAGGKSRMLVALDCFAFVQGKFTPEGPFQPGQTYEDELSQEAENHVFTLPEPRTTLIRLAPRRGYEQPDRFRGRFGSGRTGSRGQRVTIRSEVKLNGLWQVARYDDPDMDADPYEPVQQLPTPEEYELRWMGFEVPGSPWDTVPLVFGHRLIYRTRVEVPAAPGGRGFKLHFSGTNWIVSVFINGALAGTHKGVWVPWDLDISGLIKAGEVNEIAVAVKGTYYAFDVKALGRDQTLMKERNRPLDRKEWSRWVAPIYPSVKGDGDGYQYGIVNPVTLISVGDVYTEDAFIKTSVENQALATDITICNTTNRDRQLRVLCQAVHDRTEQMEAFFGPVGITVPAHRCQTVSVAGLWPKPKLWWPQPNPDLYRLRTVILEDGKPIDVQEELFGFREVTIKGTGIYINGLRRNFWNWVDVHAGMIEEPGQWSAAWREENNRFMRFSHGRRITNALKTREERLEFYDRNGIPGRLCTMIDGMFISYMLGETLRDPNGKSEFVPNELVWKNFQEHMTQVAQAYRNHPSVIFYQVENELVYINGMNIYGSHLEAIEEWMHEVCEAGRAVDPTRPYTVGGAGDLSGKLEINDPHYPTAAFDYYPENAYTVENYATKIQRWPWGRSKPWVVGESCFANELQYGAYVLGDEVFRGIDDAKRGKAKWLRMLYGGYRWAGVAGFFPWDNLWNYEDAQKVFSDLYVIPRKQTSRLYGGKVNRLRFKVMNDTLSTKPVMLEWSYRIGEEIVAENKVQLNIFPGFGKEVTLLIDAPETQRRLEGVLTLKVRQQGAKDYVDERNVPVLPPLQDLIPEVPLYVLDRQGELTTFLEERNVEFTAFNDPNVIVGKDLLLLIGADALTPKEASGATILSFAAGGGRVICLEQKYPLAGSALPAPLSSTTRFGGYAHPQALGTKVFIGLGKEDLIDWAGEHPTYKNVYQKPSQGGRSLVECGGSLEFSPLIEVPCGQGVMVLCQLRVTHNLGKEPAAEVLLRNLIREYAEYRPASGTAALYSPENPLLAEKVMQTGAMLETVSSIEESLDPAKYRVAIIHANEKNLAELNRLQDQAQRYQAAGGWILLNGLEPGGMVAFNQFLGTNHLLRPFRVERVTLENPYHKLAATLGNRDVALWSPKPIMHGRYFVSGNTYSYVIDGRDFAPFTRPPGASVDPFAYKPTYDDHDPYNFVNGMLSSDFWRYIQQIWIDPAGAAPLQFALRKPEVIETIKIWNNEIYWTIRELDIIIDGDNSNAIRTTLPDSRDLTEIKLPAPVAVQESITLQIRNWRERPLNRKDLRLVGIDNVQFLRPAETVAPVFIDNAGGIVAFERGKGGVLLCQVKFMPEEPRPENADKKLRILSVLLLNMQVGSRSGGSLKRVRELGAGDYGGRNRTNGLTAQMNMFIGY
jgi:glycosyl hydrolase family 2